MYIFWLTANMRVCEQGVHLIAVGIDMLRPHNYRPRDPAWRCIGSGVQRNVPRTTPSARDLKRIQPAAVCKSSAQTVSSVLWSAPDLFRNQVFHLFKCFLANINSQQHAGSRGWSLTKPCNLSSDWTPYEFHGITEFLGVVWWHSTAAQNVIHGGVPARPESCIMPPPSTPRHIPRSRLSIRCRFVHCWRQSRKSSRFVANREHLLLLFGI